jgi:hypothetical protein
VSKIVPLLREGADDVELMLIESARQDAPPDGSARARTLRALKGASGTAAVVGAGVVGWKWLGLFGPATTKLLVGGVGVAVVVGSAGLVVHRLVSNQASSIEAPAPSVVAPRSEPARIDRRGGVSTPVPRPPAVASHETVEAPRAPAATPSSPTPSPAPETPPTSHVAATAGPPAAVPLPPVVTPGDPAGVAPSQPGMSLHHEAVLLESVRESLAASLPQEALSSLDRYDSEFPSGALAEEAAVLRIQALLAVGRRDEAMRVSEAFQRLHPSSSYVPKMRALIDRNL